VGSETQVVADRSASRAVARRIALTIRRRQPIASRGQRDKLLVFPRHDGLRSGERVSDELDRQRERSAGEDRDDRSQRELPPAGSRRRDGRLHHGDDCVSRTSSMRASSIACASVVYTCWRIETSRCSSSAKRISGESSCARCATECPPPVLGHAQLAARGAGPLLGEPPRHSLRLPRLERNGQAEGDDVGRAQAVLLPVMDAR